MDDTWELPAETAGRLAGDILFSLDSALTCAVLRQYGNQAAADVEGNMLHSHQEHYFLDGVAKLGLNAEKSDAVRSAKYHFYSNALGGLKMGYVEESPDKAWIFYHTPYWLDSPWQPGVGVAAFKPEFLINGMRNWHANNGRLLGNPGVGFVITHLVMRGDPYDAGYFIDHHRELAPWETLVENWGELPPRELKMSRPEFDTVTWPIERQARAWRNFSIGYVGGRLYWLIKMFGEPAAAEMMEHALRITLFQRLQDLLRDLQIPDGDSVKRATLLFKRFQQISGSESTIKDEGGGYRVELAGSRFHRVPEFQTSEGGMPREPEAAFERAWAAVCHYLDRRLVLSVPKSLARGDYSWEFVFSRS